MSRTVILGSGPSIHNYVYQEGDIIYCMFSMKNDELDKLSPRYFEMHEGGDLEHKDQLFMSLETYPLQQIIEKFACAYFTNTISYILAYLLYDEEIKPEEIWMFGVDMLSHDDEYVGQRGSVMYWVGRAESLGIKVHVLSGQLDSFLYGYHDKHKVAILNQLNNLRIDASQKLNNADNEVQKNQYLGFLYALDMVRKII